MVTTCPYFGALAVQKLNLLSVNENNFKRDGTVTSHFAPVNKEAVLKTYAAVIDNTIGDLPQPAHLKTDPAVTPIVFPARKLPFSMEKLVRAELLQLVTAGVLKPVDGPTSWVSLLWSNQVANSGFVLTLVV